MFVDKKIEHYCYNNSKKISKNLEHIILETKKNHHNVEMISGIFINKILSMLTYITNAKTCVDVGTYTGFSALSMAESLPNDGIVYTIDIKNNKINNLAKKLLQKSKHFHKIKIIHNNAQQYLHTINKKIDIAFIDADKKNIPLYFNTILKKLSKNGIIIIDDILWRGEVLKKKNNNIDLRSKIIKTFNHNISRYKNLDNIILPLRHGINIIIKK